MYTLSTELLGVAVRSKHCWHMIDQAVHVGSDPLLLEPIVMLEGYKQLDPRLCLEKTMEVATSSPLLWEYSPVIMNVEIL